MNPERQGAIMADGLARLRSEFHKAHVTHAPSVEEKDASILREQRITAPVNCFESEPM